MKMKWILSGMVWGWGALGQSLMAMETQVNQEQGLSLMNVVKQERLTVISQYGHNLLDLSGRGLTNIDGLASLSVDFEGEVCLLAQIPKLWLKLSNNELSQLPSEIGRLSQLIRFDLSNNKLSQLPGEIGGLSQLAYLYLSNNRLNHLPAEIGMLRNLKNLDFSYNELSKLPSEIGRLNGLETLKVDHNKLSELPSEIENCRCFAYLDLSNNGFTQLPNIAGLNALFNLDLSSNRLTQFSLPVNGLYNLKHFDLSNNGLSCLPVEIGGLKKLITLILTHNKLSLIPVEIGECAMLEDLNLSDNRLCQLPDQLGKLKCLRYLDLSNNQLVALPKEIVRLNLESLNLMHNPVADIESETVGLIAIFKKLVRQSHSEGTARKDLAIWLLNLLSRKSRPKVLYIGNPFSTGKWNDLPRELKQLILSRIHSVTDIDTTEPLRWTEKPIYLQFGGK